MSSIVLLQSTQGFIDITGNSAKADGYFGYPDSLYTVAITTQNFIGRVFVEASLALVPTENDWFPVQLVPGSNYIEYPLIPQSPSGELGGDTGVTGYTFRGNFLYLRARVYRTYVYDPSLSDEQIALLGTARIVLSQSQTTYSSSTTTPILSGFTQLVNIGYGYQVFAGLNGQAVPQFRTIVAGDGIGITQSNDSLTIEALGTNSGSGSQNGTFVGLADTPASYVGKENALVTVNSAANALVFTPSSPVALSGLLTDTTGTLSISRGGTGLTSLAAGSLLIGSTSSSATSLSIGTNGQVLTVQSNVPRWITATASNNIPTRIVTSLGNITITSSDYVVVVRKAASEASIVNLPAGSSLATPSKFVIKDGAGNASNYNISVRTAGSDLIDGSGSFLITKDYGLLHVLWDGTTWNILNGI